jgi:hypothetical protein
VGALNSGSIASGFGTISTANNITTSQAVQGGTFTNGAGGTFNVNSSGNVALGNGSNDGELILYNNTSSNSVTLDEASSPSSAVAIHLPDTSGTVCLQTSLSCGFALTTGSSAAFTQGGNAFGATGLLGTTDNNALSIEADGNVGVTVTTTGDVGINTASSLNSGTLSVLAQSGQVAEVIQGATSQNILNLYNSTPTLVASVSSTGTILLQNSSNSTTALQVETAGGSPATIFDVDTQNQRVGIGTAAPNSVLQVVNTNGTSTPVLTLQGITSQTGNLLNLDVTNASGTLIVSNYDANGNYTGSGTNATFNSLSAPTISSLTPSTSGGSITANTYYYVMTADNSQGESLASAYQKVTTTGSTSSVAIAWGAVTGATSYKIYRNTSASFTSGALLITSSATGTAYTDTAASASAGIPPTSNLLSPPTGLETSSPGSSYYYEITAVYTPTSPTGLSVSSSGTSYYFAVTAVNSLGIESAPTTIGGSSSGNNLSWNPVSNAAYYNVYENSTNSFTGSNLLVYTTSGTQYYYTSPATYQTSTPPPASNISVQSEPSFDVSASNKTSTLSWNANNGASTYNIYRNTSNSFSSGSLFVANTASTTYTDSVSSTTAGLPPNNLSAGTVSASQFILQTTLPSANISTPSSSTADTASISISTGSTSASACTVSYNCYSSGNVNILTGNVSGNYGGQESSAGSTPITNDYLYTANEPGNINIDTGENVNTNFPTCPTSIHNILQNDCAFVTTIPSINIGTDSQNSVQASTVNIGVNADNSTVNINGATTNLNGASVNVGSGSATGYAQLQDNGGDYVQASGGLYLNASSGGGSLNSGGLFTIETTSGALSLNSASATTWFTSAGALTLTSAAAATWSTSAGTLTLQAGGGTVSLGTSTSLSTTTTGLTVAAGTSGLAVGQTLNLKGGASFSGSGGALNITGGSTGTGAGGTVSIDAGSGSASGSINIGTVNSAIVTITSGAASTWSTSSGALTLTSAAAATWSSSAGVLTLSGAAGLTLQAPTTQTIKLDQSASGTETISIGTTNATTLSLGRSGNTATTIAGAAGSSITFGSVFGVAATTGNVNAPQITGNTTLTLASASNSQISVNPNGSGVLLLGTTSTGAVEAGNTTGSLTLTGPSYTTSTKGVCVNQTAGSCGTLNASILLLDLNQSSLTGAETSGNCSTTINAGGMYYSASTASTNTTTQELRGCINGSWTDIVTSDQLGIIMLGVVPNSGTSNQGDIGGITGAANGPCKVAWASTTTVTVNPCTAYSKSRKVVITAQTTVTIPTTASTAEFSHVCLNGTNGAPTATADNVSETAGLPAFSATAPVLCLATVLTTNAASPTIANIWDTRVFVGDEFRFTTTVAAMAPGWIAVQSAANSVSTTTSASVAGVAGVIAVGNTSGSSTIVNAIIASSGPAYVEATTGTSSTFTVAYTAQTTTTAGYSTQAAAAGGYIDLGLVINPPVNSACNATTNCQYSMLVSISPH